MLHYVFKVLAFKQELGKNIEVMNRIHGAHCLILWPGKVGAISAKTLAANIMPLRVMAPFVAETKGDLLTVPVLEWCFKCLRKWWNEPLYVFCSVLF